MTTNQPPSSLPPPRLDKDLVMDERYEVLFEDADFMVVSKGAPLPAHPVSRFQERNLLSMLERDYGQKMHLANRLDSETSGLILVARNEMTAGALGAALQAKKIRKEYLAVAIGAPLETQGWIRAPIKGRRDLLCHVYEPHPEGKNAETEYTVLEKNNKYSLLKLVAHTGKTHQLRVHLKSIGCPIAGDKIYIDLKIYDHYVHHGWQAWMAETVGCSRLALHAWRLELNHPVTRQPMAIESPMPEMLIRFFKSGDS